MRTTETIALTTRLSSRQQGCCSSIMVCSADGVMYTFLAAGTGQVDGCQWIFA
ncbi:hypothetical protein [Photorhabdus sp. RM323S]|uniref:hypothetical protein n=1 Tax=Photorhabdus sp. RM323S TaxID=3342828 RepID=UPI0036D9D556